MPDKYTMRAGVRIAVDVGKARVGVAKTDSQGILATPVGTFQREKNDFSTVVELVNSLPILEIYVGLPLNMDGSVGQSAKDALRWAKRLAKRLPEVPIKMIDERLTTVTAHNQLHEVGRAEITHRSVVDQLSAVIILENALDLERNTGTCPDKVWEDYL